MALIKCPICKKRISDKASFCINCATPMDNIKKIISARKLMVTDEELTEEDIKISDEIHYIMKQFPSCFIEIKKAYSILADSMKIKREKLKEICSINNDVLFALRKTPLNNELFVESLMNENIDVKKSIAILNIWNRAYNDEIREQMKKIARW